MKKRRQVDIRRMEGRTFILGREGHIYIDSPTVSKQHAELKIINRRVYLRDLNSTNGTYLLKRKKLVHFVRGYVSPLQTIVIGDQARTILSLLEIASNFVSRDDATTQLDLDNLKKPSGNAGK